MERSFLQRYLESFHRIEGWFSYDAGLLFMAYNQLLSRHIPAGNVLEIGVHHGLSTIAIAALRGEGKRMVAIDLFEERQSENVSQSGFGNRAVFDANLRDFYPDLSFLTVLSRASGELGADDLGSAFTFCHIDGGHSRKETYDDLCLCSSITAAGGLIALDDYFNPLFPGVCEGAVEFMVRNPGVLRPLAIGYNKVIFQKTPAPGDLNPELLKTFPTLRHETAMMWDTPVLLISEPFRRYLDLHASTPARFIAPGEVVRAVLKPQVQEIRVRPGARVTLPVSVLNTSDAVFPAGARVFALSWHLMSASGDTLVHDGERSWIEKPIEPGEEVTVPLAVQAPLASGSYRLEIDLVWEGVMWFKDVGNPTAIVDLIVTGFEAAVSAVRKLSDRLRRVPGNILTALCALGLFVVNALLCHELFQREFTQRMESIESSYMSLGRWVFDHWADLSWFPVWFDGMPFHNVYQPGLPLTVAGLASLTGWTVQHAYHFFTAFEYCLGPVTLFWLCWRVTRWRGFALTAGLLYSLFSPACLLVPLIRFDTGHLLTARRFIILVRYGEGPHTTAVMLVPLVILALHYAVTERRWWALGVAPLALAAIPLTNWPGTVGLAMAILAFIASRMGSDRPMHWPVLAATPVFAYLLACPWIPPSTIALVQRNAHQSDATQLGLTQLEALGALLGVMLVLHFAFQRFRTNRWLRFFAYYTLITGVVAIGREWFGWRLVPQPHRFQVEFELAFCGLAAYIGKRLYDIAPRPLRAALICGLAVFLSVQAVRFRRFAGTQIPAIDITQTIEYRMAKWFDTHMNGHRVFAPGNVSLWMNMFTDTPQVAGCCDQGIPDQEYRIATYVIYTGQDAGKRDTEVSLLWLKAYGADAIGTAGPKSTEFFHPYWNAHKFDGVLPVLWRDGDNAVYDVQRRRRSLAHVVARQAIVSRAPVNGLDTDPLAPYVAAIEAPDAPRADFQWINGHQARINAEAKQHELVSVQVSYDRGWRATVAGAQRPISADALGMMVVDPACAGACSIDLKWDGGAEAKWTRGAQIVGTLILLAVLVKKRPVRTP